ncbi:MAG: helix-turn-helix transcriptional regulator [Roseivirga sp.]|nr:helix-turn-helix transcriptional regulator [Roseivirga sp.]
MFGSEHMGEQNLWTFLLEYSVIQGLLLAAYVLLSSKQVYLSILLTVVSLLVLNYLYEFFGWYQTSPHLIWTNVPLWFLVGPLFFLHGQTFFRKGPRFRNLDLLHFIPSAFIIVLFAEFYFFDSGGDKIVAYEGMFGNDYNFDFVQILYILQILIYGFICIRLNRSGIVKLQQNESDSSHIHLNFLRNIYVSLVLYAISALILALTLALYQQLYGQLMKYYNLVFLALASIVHVSSYHFLFYRAPKPESLTASEKNSKGTGKYASSSLGETELKLLLDRLESHIVAEGSFKNPNLRISDLASELDIPSHHISQCLSQLLHKNFFDFINKYRVEAVKQNLIDPKYRNYTLFAIASEVGFNSHSSFYRVFKKITGLTPKAFIQQNQT